jgi:hypothetical protein
MLPLLCWSPKGRPHVEDAPKPQASSPERCRCDAQAAEAEARRLWAENAEHQVFGFDDSGIDGIHVEEILPRSRPSSRSMGGAISGVNHRVAARSDRRRAASPTTPVVRAGRGSPAAVAAYRRRPLQRAGAVRPSTPLPHAP